MDDAKANQMRGIAYQLSGLRFGRLVVVEKSKSIVEGGRYYTAWRCQGDCGSEKVAKGVHLQAGYTKSCGCLLRGHAPSLTHGETCGGRRSIRYYLWFNAKTRAKKFNLPFDLRLDDIEVPDRCPVLGIELVRNSGGWRDNSPTIDRVQGCLGYVRGNVCVISLRANRLKSDASLEELQKLVNYVQAWGRR
jgi:hypothetical protein